MSRQGRQNWAQHRVHMPAQLHCRWKGKRQGVWQLQQLGPQVMGAAPPSTCSQPASLPAPPALPPAAHLALRGAVDDVPQHLHTQRARRSSARQ